MTVPVRGISHVELVMGTAVTFDLRDEAAALDGRPGLDDAIAWLHHVDRTFSPYIDDSEISRLGRGDVSALDTTAEVREILQLCQQLREESEGAFDAFSVPAPNGTMFDPSGVVKGWSIERAAEILERHGHTDFTINAGGDIAVRGRPTPSTSWRVGVRHPGRPDMVATVVELSGRSAIATSATYERGAHIIDPRTRQPTTELASATVIGPDLTFVDAYATVLFVMGVDGIAWLSRRPSFEGYVITHDDTTIATDGFAAVRTDVDVGLPAPG